MKEFIYQVKRYVVACFRLPLSIDEMHDNIRFTHYCEGYEAGERFAHAYWEKRYKVERIQAQKCQC